MKPFLNSVVQTLSIDAAISDDEGGGYSPEKFEHDSVASVDSKGPPIEINFWSGYKDEITKKKTNEQPTKEGSSTKWSEHKPVGGWS